MKNKILIGVGSLAAGASQTMAADFDPVSSLTTAVGSATTLFGLAATLGVVLIVWAIGRKVVKKGV